MSEPKYISFTRILNPLKKFFSVLFNSKSIRIKLVAAFLIPIVLIIVQGTASFINTSSSATSNATQSSLNTIGSSGQYLEVVMQTIENYSLQIFADSDVQDYLSGRSSKTILEMAGLNSNIKKTLLNLSTFSPQISNITLIPSDGEISGISTMVSIAGTSLEQFTGSSMYKSLEASDKFANWFGKHPELDELNKNSIAGYSLSYVRLIKSTVTNNIAGMLVIDIKPDTIKNLQSRIKLADSQLIYIISPDERIISDGKDDTSDNSIIKQDFYKKLLSSEKTSGSENVSYNDAEYLMTYSKISDTGYILMGLIPQKELSSGATAMVRFTVILVILAVLIAFGTGMLLANSMSKTINSIIHASGQAASGDLTVTLHSKRKDEFGKLTVSINSMIENMRALIRQTTEVSQKVTDSSQIVSSTSQQVASVSHEISKAVQEIAQGASSQASDAEHGVETISILADNINHVTENAKYIDRLTIDTMEITRNGLASIEDLGVKADRTTVISREVLADIKELDINSKSIGEIVNVISRIADQTNLLALNAAIEAARVGEYGKGFAVVADEVRKLAEQSMKATREITEIIKNTQQQTKKTVDKAADTESILSSQNEAVLDATGVFKRIMGSMDNLSSQVEQIMSRITEMEDNKAEAINSIQNISAVSEETAASSEEVTASAQEQLSSVEELAQFAEELKSSSNELQRSMSKFKI